MVRACNAWASAWVASWQTVERTPAAATCARISSSVSVFIGLSTSRAIPRLESSCSSFASEGICRLLTGHVELESTIAMPA